MIGLKELTNEQLISQCNSCGKNKRLWQIIIKYGKGNGAGGQCITLCDECRQKLTMMLRITN